MFVCLLTSRGKIEVFVMMNMMKQRISNLVISPNAVATFPHSFITRTKVVLIFIKLNINIPELHSYGEHFCFFFQLTGIQLIMNL